MVPLAMQSLPPFLLLSPLSGVLPAFETAGDGARDARETGLEAATSLYSGTVAAPPMRGLSPSTSRDPGSELVTTGGVLGKAPTRVRARVWYVVAALAAVFFILDTTCCVLREVDVEERG